MRSGGSGKQIGCSHCWILLSFGYLDRKVKIKRKCTKERTGKLNSYYPIDQEVANWNLY